MYWCQIDLCQVLLISVKFQLKIFVWFICSLFLLVAFLKSNFKEGLIFMSDKMLSF